MKTSLRALLLLFLVGSGFGGDYRAALPGYRYQFPRDYFSHPEYQTEWWYYTGNLKAQDGHRFGFELTFFRQGVARDKGTSAWHIDDLYMAHLALSDISGQTFYHSERINRAGPGIAGVNEQTGVVWNGNWQATIGDTGERLRAVDPEFNFELALKPAKPVVIHGQNGVSQKAEGAGHASHYFSLTRLLTTGSIQLNGATYEVEGSSWMDHEFFSESMASDESGWDWLSLQLDDNTELMLYRLRHKDGTVDPYSSGTYVDPKGNTTFLSLRDFTLTPEGETWTSPKTKATYPIQWKITVPGAGLQLEITTPLKGQELTSAFGPSYWEGAIDISGQRSGSAVRGVGYLEMTGYAEGLFSPFGKASSK